MRYNVSRLLQEPIGSTRHYELESQLEGTGGGSEAVRGEIQLLRTPAGVLVRARLTMVEPEICSRCLKPLDERVEINFEEEFQNVIDPRTGRLVPREERDPEAFVIDERHTLDLNEAVRQYREVSLLMQPLCRTDCRGLCPVCGTDLNESDCGHDRTPIDGRWAVLDALKRTEKGKE